MNYVVKQLLAFMTVMDPQISLSDQIVFMYIFIDFIT